MSTVKILVMSDSHERRDLVRKCIAHHPEAEIVLHLGDHAADIQSVMPLFPDKQFVFVRGNCDFDADVPLMQYITAADTGIFLAHGHTYAVKYGMVTLMEAARRQGARICLYGHTHVPCNEYHDGLYLMNPGSLAYPRDGSRPSYGLIEICPQGIMTNIVPIDPNWLLERF